MSPIAASAIVPSLFFHKYQVVRIPPVNSEVRIVMLFFGISRIRMATEVASDYCLVTSVIHAPGDSIAFIPECVH
jgi:hypothetical protein